MKKRLSHNIRVLGLLLLLILLLFVNACGFAAKEPEWVLSTPVDGAYYQAVVMLSKKVPGYVDTARENALREISTQISVQIDSDIALTETEANGIPSNDLISQIRSSSRNRLNGIQLAGTYQTDKDYWAYYRLSKSEYRFWRNQQKDLSVQQAISLLSDFDSATGDIAVGITALLKALELIVDFTDMDLSCEYKGKQVNLYNELFNRLQRLPESIKPLYASQQLAVIAKTRTTHEIPVSISYLKDNQQYPCSSFPLAFSFIKGAGDIEKKTISDTQGAAKLTIRRIADFATPQQIALSPDKEYWQSRLENPIVKKLFTQLQFSPAYLTLLVSRPKAYLEYSFDNSAGSAYKDILVKKLQDLDLEVVKEKANADYYFKVAIISHEGEPLPLLNQHTAKADAYVELLDVASGKSIYSNNLTNIKSTGNSLAIARNKSELVAINEICDKLLFMLVEQHIMN
ncbi:MAG: LPP20 family lipoprotein [Candidatus Cloacimonetes bacterium]|nr:LPP20 family lipoprotein [Candidatus Cloacimonadota bacterium]